MWVTLWAWHTNKKTARESNFLQGGLAPALRFSRLTGTVWPLISHLRLFGVRIQQTELLPQNDAKIVTPPPPSKQIDVRAAQQR